MDFSLGARDSDAVSCFEFNELFEGSPSLGIGFVDPCSAVSLDYLQGAVVRDGNEVASLYVGRKAHYSHRV